MFKWKTLNNLRKSAVGMVQPLATVGRLFSGLAALAGIAGSVLAALELGPEWGAIVALTSLVIVLLLIALRLQSELDRSRRVEFECELFTVPVNRGAFARLRITNNGPRATFTAQGQMPWLPDRPSFDLPLGFDADREVVIPSGAESFVNVAGYTAPSFRPFRLGKNGDAYQFHPDRSVVAGLPREVVVTVFAHEFDAHEEVRVFFKYFDNEMSVYVDNDESRPPI